MSYCHSCGARYDEVWDQDATSTIGDILHSRDAGHPIDSGGNSVALPGGAVTFLLTDVVGSSTLWEGQPEAMRLALSQHDDLLAQGIADHGGWLIKSRGEGDSIFAVFERADAALEAAVALQLALLTEQWPTSKPLKVRMAMHTGEAELRAGDYFGLAVNRCARLRDLAHGRQILVSHATYTLIQRSLPRGADLRLLGTYQLKGHSRPEHVFQALYPGLPDAFPPLKGQTATLSNLPTPVSSFIGREWELAEVTRLLEQTRLLTLVGSGGCGKTRLALKAASAVLALAQSPDGIWPSDGVWLVELAGHMPGVPDPLPLVAQTVATALGIVEASGSGSAGQFTLGGLIEFLREREILLILDNCEHLIAACATLAAALLSACPDLRILATSQEALGIEGEMVWRVPSLSLPRDTPLVLPAQVAEYEATRLFMERARAHRPSLTLTTANAAAVVRICRQLDGIPLAIELAAARVGALSVEALANRLDDRFHVLTSGNRAALPRQKTLRAMMDWSYALLGEAERTVLRRLSVFQGGWTLEAAEAICADPAISQEQGSDRTPSSAIESPDVLGILAGLVAKSLVIVTEHDEHLRYGLLETVRQYAAERLKATDEAMLIHAQHRDWYLALAEKGEAGLTGGEQAAWLERLEREHDNLRACLAWSERYGDGVGALQLAAALWRFWEVRGHLSEGRRWVESALACSAGAPVALRARALNGAGTLARRQSDFEQAAALHEESLALYRTIDHAQGIAASLNNRGIVAEHQGDYARAAGLYEESLEMRRELGDRRGTAFLLNNLGNLAQLQGMHQRAAAYYEESLALVRALGDTQVVATLLANLGNVAREQGEFAQAKALLYESLTLFRGMDDTWGVALALLSQALVFQDQGDYEHADAICRECLTLHDELGDMEHIAQDLQVLANVAAALGNGERAARLHGAAESLRQTLGVPLEQTGSALYARAVGEIRSELGEDCFGVAWAAGRAMTKEEAIAYALA